MSYQPNNMTSLAMISLTSLTLSLPYIGGQGGRKGSGSSSINDLYWHQKQWRSNQIAESLIKRIPQPHIQCAPVYSALLAMEDQVMKSVFRSYSFVRKARADERELMFLYISLQGTERVLVSRVCHVYDQLLHKCEPAIIVVVVLHY